MGYAATLLLAALGLLLILKPIFWWDLTERWKSNGTEPSEQYLHNTRIRGYTYIGIAVLFLLILLSL